MSPLRFAPVALDVLVRQAVAAVRPRIAGGAVTLAADLPRQLVPLVTDAGRLAEVLALLLDNAVRFTAGGAVTVRLRTEALTGRPLRLDVVDTGIGIAPERHAALLAGLEPGTGLPRARALCEELGFRLAVASALGGGTMFSVLLAEGVDVAGDPPTARPLPPRAAPRSRGLALVIDADRPGRLPVAHAIEALGFEVVMTASGVQGVAMARELRPRFIALDLLAPDLAGLEVLAQLRAEPALAGVPVLLVSAVAREYGQVVPGADLLEKPLDAAALARALERHGVVAG
ncbi:MAG TPA: ATP-binding protein [Gemmatimonadales bacterium]|nr:ATP-binding protein [Gemmatimonadales bacterium]